MNDQNMSSSKPVIAIVAAKWNSIVTDEMVQGAKKALAARGYGEDQVPVYRCPGAFELPLAAQWALEQGKADAVVAIGAVSRGGTPHFEYVCDAVTRGIADLNLRFGKPVAFGVLTTDDVRQARERAGQDKGNKGAEAAIAVLEMLELRGEIRGAGA
jgi:6,7-dimethyl-8-ribityllumazine synthase